MPYVQRDCFCRFDILVGHFAAAALGIASCSFDRVGTGVHGFAVATPYDPDWGYGLARAALFWAVAIVGGGILLRVLADLAWHNTIARMARHAEERAALAAVDATLWLLFAGWLGCAGFWLAALGLQGTAAAWEFMLRFRVWKWWRALPLVSPSEAYGDLWCLLRLL